MFEQLIRDSYFALPILNWGLLAIALIIVQIIFQKAEVTLATTLVGLIAMLGYASWSFDAQLSQSIYFGQAQIDSLAQFFNILGIITVLAVCLISAPSLFNPTSHVQDKSKDQFPEYLICLILCGFGIGVTVSAYDLASLFLGIETLSIGLFALCGFYRFDVRSTESALKYLLASAFATCILLFGMALIYGATGSTNLLEIFKVIEIGDTSLIRLGSLLLVGGLAFKLALVPFHFYTPDVYEGAPTPITAFLATAVKISTIAAALRLFQGALAPAAQYWEGLWLGLCILSIIFGNLAALQQQTIKKLFAFSSVAHAGFLGLGLLVSGPGMGSLYPLLAYLVIYTVVSLGIFSVIAWIENRDQVFYVSELKALGLRRPLIGLLFSVLVLGLAGIPPFAGFMIKFWIFQALIEQGYIATAILAVIGSVIGLGYYLKILMYLFMSEKSEQGAAANWTLMPDRGYMLRLVAFSALAVTLLGGFIPHFYADWILTTIAIK